MHELKDFSFTFLELPKFNKTIDELSSMEEKWMYFFKHATQTSEEELEKITGPDIVIRQAYGVLNEISRSEPELNAYEREKKSQLDGQAMLTYAERKGEEKGRAEGKIEVAKKLFAQGIDIQTIMYCTGLSKEEFEQIKF